jgi:hypothetical protein
MSAARLWAMTMNEYDKMSRSDLGITGGVLLEYLLP